MMKDCNGLFRLVRRRTTILPLFLLGLSFVSTTLAQPQQVTVREINDIHADSVATLIASDGDAADAFGLSVSFWRWRP